MIKSLKIVPVIAFKALFIILLPDENKTSIWSFNHTFWLAVSMPKTSWI